MFRPLRITLDRFINRRRSKDIYETVFSLYFHIFLLFYKTDFRTWRINAGPVLRQSCGASTMSRGGMNFPSIQLRRSRELYLCRGLFPLS